jgi:hypothetical protein
MDRLQTTVPGIQIPDQGVETLVDLDPVVGAPGEPDQLQQLEPLAGVGVGWEAAGEVFCPEAEFLTLSAAPFGGSEAVASPSDGSTSPWS